MRKILFLICLFSINLISYSQTKQPKQTNLLIPAKVDSIRIVGNETTKEFIILRELTFKVGDNIDSSSLHFNRERIFSLALFNRVELYFEKQNDINILVIDVDETWYWYPVPFWYSKNNSWKTSTFGMNFLLKNFRGRNENIRFGFGIGFDKYFSVSYENPAWLYNHDIGFNVSLGYYNTNNKNKEAEILAGNNYSYEIVRVYLSSWKRINQFNLIGGAIVYDHYHAKTNPKKSLTASGKTIDNFPSLRAFYIFDTRDLKLFSSDGIYSFINYYHRGFSISNANYNILEFDLRGYKSIYDELTSKIRLYHRNTFGKNVPYYDYSYLGYNEKIRGHSSAYYEGRNSFLGSAEISYPLLNEWNLSLKLPLIPRSLTSARIAIHLNSFGDAGIVFNKQKEFALNTFHYGYGLGITILLLPYNAFRFEYAINEFGKGEIVLATGFSF